MGDASKSVPVMVDAGQITTLFDAASESPDAEPTLRADAARPATIDGTWTGSVAAPGAIPVGIRLVLQEQDGQVTGHSYVQDPSTGTFLIDAEIVGWTDGYNVAWTTSTELLIEAERSLDELTGTLDYPADGDLVFATGELHLTR